MARNRPSCSAVIPPSRPFISNSSRSKFDDTWMSIDGLKVGTTSRVVMSPAVTKRVRMSFVLEAITKSLIGAPISRAIQPAKTLPKFPVGTLKLTGPLVGVASASAATT